MKNPKVSVIIPVYNAEKYLAESIRSVKNQTFSDIEVILVNDGSNDGSKRICGDFSSEDERVVLINKKNEGAGKARLTGIDAAMGEYVCFLDADDLMEETFIEKMYGVITEKGADLAECGYYIFSEHSKDEHHVFSEDKTLERKGFLEKVVEKTIIDGTEAVVLWNKIYKRSYLDKYVNIHTANILEDYLFNMQYYYGVEKYAYIDQCLINYRVAQNSLSRSFHADLFDKFKEILPIKEKYMDMFSLNDQTQKEKHFKWYMRYISNYLKSGVGQPEFLNIAEKVLNDEYTLNSAKFVRKGFLASCIRKKKVNCAIIYIYIKGIIFNLKKKLYRIKRLIK